MLRRPRLCPPGYVYHVLNRGVGRMTPFEDDAGYEAFERVRADANAGADTDRGVAGPLPD